MMFVCFSMFVLVFFLFDSKFSVYLLSVITGYYFYLAVIHEASTSANLAIKVR